MDQHDLFDGPGQHHRDAPDTEVEAAHSVDAPGLRRLALAEVRRTKSFGLIAWHLCELHPEHPPYSLRPRLTELKDRGLIIRTERRRPNGRGKRECVWVATEYAG